MGYQLHPMKFICCLLIAMSIQSGASAANWAPTLEDSQYNGYRKPKDSIRILIPPSVPNSVLQRLSLELDTIDVTAMLERDGDYVVYNPIQPLEYGHHELRIVDYLEDGSIEEIGYWEFEVRQSRLYQQASFAANVNALVSQRIADHNLGQPEPDEFQAQAGAVLQTNLADENWELEANMDLLYISDETLTTSDREIDMGEFLVTANINERIIAKAGHHSMTQNSLVMDNFYRRGVSSQFNLNEINSVASTFIMRTNDIVGFEEGLGVSDAENRVSGATWDYQPITSNPEMLILSTTYINGEGTQDGIGIGTTSLIRNEGDAWSLAADSKLFNQQLRIRAELAESSYDFDGVDQGLSAESDDANSLLAVYTPLPPSNSATPLQWNIGIETLEVGTFFKTLGNTTLPADKDLTRFFGGLNKGSWATEISLAIEENNLDNNPNLATIETKQNYASLSYSAYEPPKENSSWAWLGMPSYNLIFSEITFKDLVTPTSLDRNNNKSESIALSGNFNYNTWSWALGFVWSDFEDFEDLQIDTETFSSDFSANFQIKQRWQLGPTIQIDETKDKDFNTKSTTTIYGIQADFIAIPDKLTGNFNINVTDIDNPNDIFFAEKNENTIFTGEVIWHWIEPKVNKPGFDVSLSVAYQDTNDDLSSINTINSNQIFLNLVMTLPATIPGN